MHISWNFLDKRKAAMDAISVYHSMQFIIDHTEEDLMAAETKMEGVGSPNMDGLPHAHNPAAAEDRMVKCIEEIDTIKERYRQAVEYMNWFKPAWEQLSEDDRYVLDAFFMDGEECKGAADIVADYFGIERTSAYSKRKRAIERLTTLLYGKA